MKVKIKKINDKAIIPSRGSSSAAGYDLYAVTDMSDESLVIEAGKTVKVKTGLSMEIPEGYFGAIYPRSGLSTKQGLRLANCVGVVDPDYRGEVMVALYNDSNDMQTITSGERIAQIVITPYLPVEFEEVDELNDTERSTGGFGSTGKK